ncbi:PREDICTED: transmembrane protein 179 [Diuraphis noxia]|uniref:transmembrane protein 179 n=1 Tax=Diuraphis noxia TaxID=143948 RepID=UPI0007635763|nr:PREDICTED: transmembrane protein 179 [Diuraphis noxia]XP_015367467.1 PREDICTED: transmembrane protein 179 [Diuraphis noxia]XP_015367475.1 PREDICTED: transmembrane protein 179 [Diuraphis noxia]XP_015367483.1 PREDICTED: transmembrane protein 179 [Diuraphis noxia]XP_015367491.1 PREDICTED: transmembrane protein 179 [Diuraphis noxia]
MALTNKLLLSQVAGYTIAAILSLCIIIPMSLHQDEFKGHCLLFSSGQWLEKNGQFLVNWASQAYCNYSIFVGVLLLVISSIQTYRMSIFAYKGTDSSFLLTFIDAITCVLMCIFTINAALMITFGFMTWCNDMIERFPSCEMAAGNPIDIQDGIDTSGFYFQLGVAQFGIWASWSCWVGLTVCTMCKLCYYHQMSNMKASMLRERQKLIDEGMAAPTRVTPYTTQTDSTSDESNNSKIESQPSKSINDKNIK